MTRRQALSFARFATLASAFLLPACRGMQEKVKTGASEAAAAIEEALSPEPTRPAPASVHESRFDQIVEIYLDAKFRHDPPAATRDGFHGRDGELGDLSREAIEATVATLRRLHRDLEGIDPRDLTGDRRRDHDLLSHRIKADLLDLESIRPWERDPNFYLGRVSEGFFSLLAREFAPAPTRAASAVARAEKVEEVIAAARRNLKNPPRVWTEVAIDQTKGAITYLGTEAPAAFPAGTLEGAAARAFREALAKAEKGLADYLAFLEEDLLPRSRGSFAIGEDLFARKLFAEERVAMPIAQLLVIGEEEVARLEDRLRETAKRIDPNAEPAEILRRLAREHPPADAVVAATDEGVAALRRFCVERRIVSLPTEQAPAVRPTPAFRRAYTFASMDMPGPFERVAREAFYSVTLPEEGATPERAEELLRFFNRYALPVISAHEAYPGHFTQLLHGRRHPSTVRRFVGCSTNLEGWAHYCEEMMLDEGFGGDDPGLRLAQIRLALVRACRYVVGVRLHTRGMTLAEATRYFIEHAHLEPANAEREARRGTSDPTYLAYTLGKKMILKLREDFRAARGPLYDLGEFHDAFLSCGYPPIPVVRAILLPGDAGSVL